MVGFGFRSYWKVLYIIWVDFYFIKCDYNKKRKEKEIYLWGRSVWRWLKLRREMRKDILRGYSGLFRGIYSRGRGGGRTFNTFEYFCIRKVFSLLESSYLVYIKYFFIFLNILWKVIIISVLICILFI